MSNVAQTITFNALTAVTYSLGGTVSLTGNAAATASSNLVVSYASSDASVATISGTTVTILKGGFTDITASQAGDGTFAAATNVVQRLTINKISQTITFGALNAVTYSQGGTVTLTATASSSLTVSYVSSDTSVATISGTTVTTLKGGATNITASQAGNDFYAPATNVIQAFTINKISQTITFNTLTNLTYSPSGTSTLTATASSSLTVTFSSSIAGVATVSGTTLTIVGGGNTTITASQAGNDFYSAATNVTQNQEIVKANQTITFDALTNKIFSDVNVTLTATASSGLTITYSSSATNVGTISGSILTFVNIGSTNITASQAGNSNYNAATNVVRSQQINIGNQTITFAAPNNLTYSLNGTSTLGATVTSGLTISYSSSDANVATVSGNTLTIIGAGTTNITASQAGNTNFNPASNIVQSQVIVKADQTITFNTPNNLTYLLNGTSTLSASSSSTLTVTFTSSLTNFATISGTTLSIIGAGTTVITASQAGNSNYNAATNVTRNQVIEKANQSITFAALANQTYSPNGVTVNLSATVNTGLSISFISSNTNIGTISSTTLSLIAAGSTDITARAVGNDNYNQTDLVRTQTVDKANQTITFTLSAITYSPSGTSTLTASSNSGLTISYTSSSTNFATVAGNTLTIVGAGTTVITAAQAGNSNYNAATNVTQSQVINKAAQTITFAALASVPYSTLGTISLTATSDSGLTVSFASSNIYGLTLDGTTLTIQGVSSSVITASQAGNVNYNAATDVLRTQTITKVADPICFNEGTYILCLNKNFKEEYVFINDLTRGAIVKTYKHGYRKIEMIGKCPMVNDPNNHSCCMYKMVRNDHNGLIEDLTVTGGHSLLVNNIDQYREENERLMGATQKIDDKYLLLAAASPNFVKLENTDTYTYYHFILENNGNDDERFGVWSNGILTETPSKRQFLQNSNLIIF